MVFVWSYLTDGDPAYTLVQVSVNDLIMLVAFAPIVKFLVSGRGRAAKCRSAVLLYSVLIFVVIPLALGAVSRARPDRAGKGAEWFEARFLPAFHPVTVLALLATLVAHLRLPGREHHRPAAFHVVLIAIPILHPGLLQLRPRPTA